MIFLFVFEARRACSKIFEGSGLGAGVLFSDSPNWIAVIRNPLATIVHTGEYTREIGRSVQSCLGISVDKEVSSENIWPRMSNCAFRRFLQSGYLNAILPFRVMRQLSLRLFFIIPLHPQNGCSPRISLLVKFLTDACLRYVFITHGMKILYSVNIYTWTL